jgi:hypothetical protein
VAIIQDENALLKEPENERLRSNLELIKNADD